MEIELVADLGRRLRTRRTAAGRTIASVAMQAGLSVPYIANLENGRGNPTVAALANLARALDGELRVELIEPDRPVTATDPVAVPPSLARFIRLPRFADETRRLAETTGQPVTAVRERLLTAMVGVARVGAAPVGPEALGELDWHRILDVIVLIALTRATPRRGTDRGGPGPHPCGRR